MEDLLGIKNINSYSEQSEESLMTTFCKVSFGNFPQDDRGKCITPPEFLSSQSSLRNSALPVQGGRKFAKAGFTLAEVLITLGIIGVVAAMTIPNLIASAQKQAAVVGIQEAQSILNQAVKMYAYESDEDGAGEFDLTLSPQAFAEKYFKPYLKVAQVCTKKEDGCWQTNDFYGYYDIAMRPKTDTINYSLVLNNGMILGFGKIRGYNLLSIVVDINGKSKRNVMGRDVFVFYPFNKDFLCAEHNAEKASMMKNGIYPGGFDNCGVPHVAFSRQELLGKSLLRTCNKTIANDSGGRTGAGSACAALIYKDGWKVSSDYPW